MSSLSAASLPTYATPCSKDPETTPSITTTPFAVLLYILTFIATPPCLDFDESLPVRQSPLTHIYPLVSKLFCSAATKNIIWTTASEFMCKLDDNWKKHHDQLSTSFPPSSPSHSPPPKTAALEKFKATEKSLTHEVLPMFFMRSRVSLSRQFSLHFFEQRYRNLIARVMEGAPNPYDCKTAGEAENFRKFIYCPASRTDPGTAAFLVSVSKCEIAVDGRANVTLFPFVDVVLERSFVLSGDDEDVDLHSARCREIGGTRAITIREAEDVAGPTGLGGTDTNAGLLSFIQLIFGGGPVLGEYINSETEGEEEEEE